MITVFLGPPGSGKGTQAKKLSATRRWPQLSTGDMFRAAIAEGSELGMRAGQYMSQGALVPDEVVIGLIRDRISKADCSEGFILDGFPRTLTQAKALDEMLSAQGRKISAAALFEIADSELVKRLTGRRTCSKCGAMFHIETLKPKQEGLCDQCGGPLFQRDDDREEVIRKRLDVYAKQTFPLIEFYRGQSKLFSVDARRAPNQVMSDLLGGLKSYA
ncbi:MAG: adenylate kinase [Oligoflexia bacterium]|jgi:adenylate kinase